MLGPSRVAYLYKNSLNQLKIKCGEVSLNLQRKKTIVHKMCLTETVPSCIFVSKHVISVIVTLESFQSSTESQIWGNAFCWDRSEMHLSTNVLIPLKKPLSELLLKVQRKRAKFQNACVTGTVASCIFVSNYVIGS